MGELGNLKLIAQHPVRVRVVAVTGVVVKGTGAEVQAADGAGAEVAAAEEVTALELRRELESVSEPESKLMIIMILVLF